MSISNIEKLIEKMKEEIQEHGDMHGHNCSCNMESPDKCDCEEMEFWGSQIAKYMEQVNDWWIEHALAHRKHCSKEGNKNITKLVRKPRTIK